MISKRLGRATKDLFCTQKRKVPFPSQLVEKQMKGTFSSTPFLFLRLFAVNVDAEYRQRTNHFTHQTSQFLFAKFSISNFTFSAFVTNEYYTINYQQL